MPTKWKTVSVREELWGAAERTLETSHYRSLSEFVSEAIRLRLHELKQGREVLERPTEYPVIRERLLYTQRHIWAMVTPGGNVRVGLSDYAQRHLNGISGIQTKPVGSEVKRKEPFGVVQTWMFMFDLYSPVSGKIIQINKVLQDEPFTISKDPHKAGWIAEIKPNDQITLEDELRDLMSLHQYKMWLMKLGRR